MSEPRDGRTACGMRPRLRPSRQSLVQKRKEKKGVNQAGAFCLFFLSTEPGPQSRGGRLDVVQSSRDRDEG
jgi:hypothetical protein